jgi:type II secretory pathway pseudopilin PulG
MKTVKHNGRTAPPRRPAHRHTDRAFTLVEVMVAITIFFMAMFAILGVLSSGVHAASILRTSGPTAGMVAAEYYATNSLEEGSDTGDFDDIPVYQKAGWRWVSEKVDLTDEGVTNMWRVLIVVVDPNGTESSRLQVLLYKPGGNKNRMGLQQQR